jgi:hypothetical protein
MNVPWAMDKAFVSRVLLLASLSLVASSLLSHDAKRSGRFRSLWQGGEADLSRTVSQNP